MKAPNSAPLGFLRLATQYLSAASLVQLPPSTELEELKQRLSLPAYFLVGHAIELALKGFLASTGISIEELRKRAYGHDLTALIDEAMRRKLESLVQLNAREIAAITTLNEMYGAKELEYLVDGVRALPHYSVAHATATKLCEGLLPHCRRLASNPPDYPPPATDIPH